MIAVIAFTLGAAFWAALTLHLLRVSRRSDDELIQRFQQEMRALEGDAQDERRALALAACKRRRTPPRSGLDGAQREAGDKALEH
jgi:hypothetical protein